MAKRPPSYAWSGHTDVADKPELELSEPAQEGLGYALELAYQARERVRELLHGLPLSPPPTLEELAVRDGRTTAEIRGLIGRARRELFGAISDSAIYKRRQRLTRRPRSRPCQQPRCSRPLPSGARSNRRYCDLHSSGPERVRRYRATGTQRPDHRAGS
jgi:hypothetical protein